MSTTHPLWWFFAAGLVVVLAACAEGSGTTNGAVDPETDPATLEEDLPDAPEDTPSVGEVFAAIAEMGLTYEERLDYLYERAIAEGAVLQYGSPEIDLQEAWSEGFQDAYPEINHLYVRQRSDDLFERVLAEARSDRHLVDVIITNQVIGSALHGEGLIADHHGIPVPEGYPDRYVEDWTVVGFVNPHVITWNTNAIAEEDAAREWDDFLRPEHSGCIIDVGAQTFAAAMILDRGYDAAAAWFEGFLANGGVVRRGHSGSTRALAAGELDCAVYLYNYDVEGMIVDDGAPLEWRTADPTPASAVSVYIYKHTERPHAAALLAHWILDRDGAQLVGDGGRVSVHPEVENRFERMQLWAVPGSDLERRLLVAEGLGDVDDQALELLETYLVPNLIQD